MSQTECNTLYNQKKLVPTESLTLRPSVYGVVKEDDKVLLIRGSETGVLAFPGGGIDLGERMEAALKREMMEEAGIEVEVGDFIMFKENFFYYDPSGEAYHTLLFVYECTPLTEILSEAHLDTDGDNTEEPIWREIATLTEQDFVATDKEFFVELRKRGIL